MMQEKCLEEDDLVARDYQIRLMEIGIEKNTIIYLPTGTGKTFIAVMILRQLAAPLERPVRQGGKVSVMLVNTVTLVDQQSKYIRRNTHFTVGAYTGDMNVDNWDESKWIEQINNYQVLVMTTQIFANLIEASILSLNNVNLLMFDECHSAVNQQPMRQVMLNFKNVETAPRVIGLTSTLLNRNCTPQKVISEVRALEITFHSQVATIDELEDVIGYSTNPTEIVKTYTTHEPSFIEISAIHTLKNMIGALKKIKIDENSFVPPLSHLKPLFQKKGMKDMINLIEDAILHINIFGIYGGKLAVIAHMIQLERMKKSCSDAKLLTVIEAVMTMFILVKKVFADEMQHFDEKAQFYRFSSHQVIVLVNILKDFKLKSNEPLCGIVFVKRRFTAKVLYNVLLKLNQVDPEFNHVIPNFIVGFNTNPFNDTREGLYNAKVNRKVLNQFIDKEITLLVSSNVLEEGVDIPLCTLIVRFDEPLDYRSYIQSKGRARHKQSFFYMMISEQALTNFEKKYETYQKVEYALNFYFMGQNESRNGPSMEDIEELYNEQEIQPYFTNGPGSAQVSLTSAISLLCRYCMCLPSDKYTTYAPRWYIDDERKPTEYKVVIELPVACPILEPVEGCFMKTKKLAKKAAALKTCELLHKIGELDDKLQPKRYDDTDENLDVYFKHWPTEKETGAGLTRKRRMYTKQVPNTFKAQIHEYRPIYLHIIKLNPLFTSNCEPNQTIYQLYTSSLSFGLISSNPLPVLCEFSVYVSLGEILVNLEVNKQTLHLSGQQIYELRHFHCLIFKDLLKVLKSFLIFDNDKNVEGIIVVPTRRNDVGYDIDFETVRENKKLISPKQQPSTQEKLKMEVTDNSHLGKIVNPWYRNDDKQYLVTCICNNLNAYSLFPSDEYASYIDYFNDKYQTGICNPTLPLLLVKGLSKRMNCLKPRSIATKRNKEMTYEEMEEHLLPELCVRQNFPAALWIQAILLPSILHRIYTLSLADELRRKIAQESGLGIVDLPSNEKWNRLQLDPHLLNFKIEEPKPKVRSQEPLETDLENVVTLVPQLAIKKLSQDFTQKKLANEYSWEEKDEPIDIERNLHVTLMDIQYYENFMAEKVSAGDRLMKNIAANRREFPAITFNKDFIKKPILLLNLKSNHRGPELTEIFRTLASTKCNDVVNLERLETLGDSFLKLSISLFIFLKYPTYNEGKATTLKGRLISNKNLYYIGANKKLSGYLQNSDFNPNFEWKPPHFCVPQVLIDKIVSKRLSATELFDYKFSNEEQVSGILNLEVEEQILKCMQSREIEEKDTTATEKEETDNYDSMYSFLEVQIVPDKTVADSVEALLGAYFQSCGFHGGLKLLEWLEIIPKSQNIVDLLQLPIPNPVLSENATTVNIDFHMPSWKNIEERLGYHFNNRAYLLQALTHSSYTPNRVTNCYQTLEFLGDAILDFLITCHIYETCENLNPGQLTDLRSALVNNITFAGFTVRCGFHKFLLYSNTKLSEYIDNFVQFQESKNFAINDEVLILLEEDDMYMAEHVDVPKVLGDVFEALAGAVFLDSGMSLQTVWNVFYKIMWKEIEMFRNNVPKNAIRLLYETVGAHPVFHPSKEVDNGKIMVSLDFMLNGERKRVYGFGDNKVFAKKAAAKIALRLLHK